MQVDCHDGEGERVVAEIVTDMKDAGVNADGEIREAQFGHIARNILAAADEHDAGSSCWARAGARTCRIFRSAASRTGCCTRPAGRY